MYAIYIYTQTTHEFSKLMSRYSYLEKLQLTFLLSIYLFIVTILDYLQVTLLLHIWILKSLKNKVMTSKFMFYWIQIFTCKIEKYLVAAPKTKVGVPLRLCLLSILDFDPVCRCTWFYCGISITLFLTLV